VQVFVVALFNRQNFKIMRHKREKEEPCQSSSGPADARLAFVALFREREAHREVVVYESTGVISLISLLGHFGMKSNCPQLVLVVV